MGRFFFGFADELTKYATEATDRIAAGAGLAGWAGHEAKKHRGKLSAISAATGIPVGALVGLLMGGKGRRLRGMGIGAGVGGAAGAISGARTPESIISGAKRMVEAAEKKAAMKDVTDQLTKEIGTGAGAGALTGGSLAALIAALASKKGLKLKRALAGGAAGGLAGGLATGGKLSKDSKFLLDVATKPE